MGYILIIFAFLWFMNRNSDKPAYPPNPWDMS